MSRGYKHNSNGFSKQRAKSLDLNHIDHMLDLMKHKVRTQPL